MPIRRQEPESSEGSRAGSRGSSDGSTGSTSSSRGRLGPFGLEQDEFTPPEEADAGARAGEQLDDALDYEPPPRELIEWTPDRAASVIRVGGFLLHTADPLTDEPGGEKLWRATEQDVENIGPPLARILNRYEPARRLAGVADEGELAIGMLDYMRRNLATRGRLRVQRKARLEADVDPGAGGLFGPEPEPEP